MEKYTRTELVLDLGEIVEILSSLEGGHLMDILNNDLNTNIFGEIIDIAFGHNEITIKIDENNSWHHNPILV